MPRICLAVVIGFALLTDSRRLFGDDTPVDTQVVSILKRHCHTCHGQDGTIEGGLNSITELPKLISRGKIRPNDPKGSSIYRRMESGSMPPAEVEQRPTDEEIELIRRWIADGAKLPKTPISSPSRVTSQQISAWIISDLEQLEPRSRRFQRYFSLAHLAAQGLNSEERQTYVNATGKLINSLSWHPKIRKPEPVDNQGLILRIDLRWYMWDATLWNRMLQEYPYGIEDNSRLNRIIITSTGTRMPIVNADWFVATASRAPLYYELLQLPGNVSELERELRVDVQANIQQDRAVRIGFNGSGVSRSNRILERHNSVHGAYWRTYDFQETPQNLAERSFGQLPDRRNIFAFPLGPGLVEQPFQHAGGEAIFSLPNGLHGYYIMDINNDRINKAPTEIVSDPKRPDRTVETAVSCMNCHVTGIIPKADQIREHAQKNRQAFSRKAYDRILGLYRPKDKSLAIMQVDAKQYADALAEAGVPLTKTEPVAAVTRLYEADVDLSQLAAELLMTEDQLRVVLTKPSNAQRSFGATLIPGGTVSRQTVVQNFNELAQASQLGRLFQANEIGTLSADGTAENDPLESLGNIANAAVMRPDGKAAIVAGNDKAIHIRDVASGRDLQLLVGHRATVWSVAISADQKRIASGAADGSVIIWNAATGDQLVTIDAHSSLVSSVGFAKDDAWLLSCSYDGSVVVWDSQTGEEVARLDNMSYVSDMAISPDESEVAIATYHSVIIWNLRDWSKSELTKHPAGSIAYSNAGTTLYSIQMNGTASLHHKGKTWKTLSENIFDVPIASILNDSVKGQFIVKSPGNRLYMLDSSQPDKLIGTEKTGANEIVLASVVGNGKRLLTMDQKMKFAIIEISETKTIDPPANVPPSNIPISID